MDGVTALGKIKAINPDVRVLVLTTYDSDADILPAIEAGAMGYLLKDTSREDLYAAVRATARGESVLSPGVAARIIGQMRAPAEEKLSTRELEVLQLVAEGYSNNEIASRLHISRATVKSHLIHIFAGILVLIRVLYRNMQNKYSAASHLGFSLSAIFWHFVDALWIYLFLFFYFIR